MRKIHASACLFALLALAACGAGDPETPKDAGTSGPDAAQPGPDAALPGPDAMAPGPISPERSMLIVTTAATVKGSRQLEVYAQAKRDRGMKVAVATEADYGEPDERGRQRALSIRAYLKTQYRSFHYLLLVGDPETEYGDVPMLKVRPRDDLQNACGGTIDCETSGTDAFYANPNGDWDLNGNGIFAEWGKDDQKGGVDLYPEMAVGRIPVYFGDTDELDKTLEHVLSYMNADPAQLAYRKKFLAAKAFVFFQGEIFFPNTPPIQDNVDMADDAEWFINHYLPPERGVTVTRLYEREGVVTSKYASEGALTRDNFIDEWKKGYGMIWWGGHGAPIEVVRTVWTADTNGNQAADGDELQTPPLIQTEDAQKLEGTPGGFVVASSCYVGRIEVPDSLSYTLIRHGGAVGVIASSAPEGGKAIEITDPQLDRSSFDVDRAGILIFDGLLKGEAAGDLMVKARLDLGPDNDIDSFQEKLMINFYGDPSLTLYDSAADVR
jgi:hypothetical protein